MRIRVSMELEIPDSFFLEGEYENASIQQTVWDNTVKQLETHNLQMQLKAYSVKDEATRNAMIKFYDIWTNIFKNCKYNIQKITNQPETVSTTQKSEDKS